MASSYNSFYGGRRGASFVIVKSYLDIQSMVKEFEQGSGFNEVHFGEYVIINNPNKNHPDNGKLFRRGMDFNSDRTISGYITKDSTGAEVTPDKSHYESEEIPYPYTFEFRTDIPAKGAEFVGTIIGPEGKAPHLTLSGYDEVAENYRNGNENGMQTRVRYGSFGPTQTKHTETDDQTGADVAVDNLQFESALVPGKEGNLYNDNIEWVSASLRDVLNRDTIVQIGLKIPYKVTDIVTHAISAYDSNNQYSGEPTVDYLGDRAAHPFYDKWDLGIPKGIKGDSLRDMRITTIKEFIQSPDSNDSTKRALYKLVPGSNDLDTYAYSIEEWYPANELSSIDSEIRDDLQIIVCSAISYERKKEGELITCFLGYFTQLADVKFNDGKLILTFTSLDKDNRNKVQFDINYVNDVELKQNGEVIFKYADASQKISQNKIKWIKNIEFITEHDIFVGDEIIDLAYIQSEQPQFYAKIKDPDYPLDNDKVTYKLKTLGRGVPDTINEDEIHQIKDGTDTIIRRAGDWNTLDDNYEGIFLQGQTRDQYKLIIQYNIQEDNDNEEENSVKTTKKYVTIIPFVNSLSYDDKTGVISYSLASSASSYPLTQITKIKNIVLEDNGQLRTYVDAIPDNLIETNEEGVIIKETDNYHYKDDQVVGDEDNYLKTGHIKTVESFSFITEDDITEAQTEQDIEFLTKNKGKLVVKYTDNTVETLTDKPISMIEDFTYNPDTNEISYFNNKTKETFNLPIMLGLDYDYDQGDIVYYISQPKKEQEENTEQQQQGETQESTTPKPYKVTFSNKVPFIQKVGLNQATNKLYFQFNKGASGEDLVEVTAQDENREDFTYKLEDGWYEIGDMSSYPMTPLPATNITYAEFDYYFNNLRTSSQSEMTQEEKDLVAEIASRMDYIVNAGGPVAADQMRLNESEQLREENFSKNSVVKALNYLFKDGQILIYNNTSSNFEEPATEQNFKGYAVTIGMDLNSGDKDFYVYDWGKSLQPLSSERSWYYLGHLSSESSISVINNSTATSSAPYSGYVFVSSSQLKDITIDTPIYITFEKTIRKILTGKTYKNVIKELKQGDTITIKEIFLNTSQNTKYIYSSSSEEPNTTNQNETQRIFFEKGTVSGTVKIRIENVQGDILIGVNLPEVQDEEAQQNTEEGT